MRFLKIVSWTLLSLCLFALSTLAALPSLLSTQWGKEQALKVINWAIPGHVAVGRAHLSWFGSQSVEGFAFKDAEGNLTGRFQKLTTDTSLLYLLAGGRSFGETTLVEPYFHLIEEETSPADQGLSKEKRKKTKTRSSCPAFKEGLTVKNGTLIVHTPKIEPVTLSQINLTSDPHQDTYRLSLTSEQGGVQGNTWACFSLRARERITSRFGLCETKPNRNEYGSRLNEEHHSQIGKGDEEDRLGEVAASPNREVILSRALKDQGSIELQAQIKNFPAAILDQWQETTLFTKGLGSHLSLDIGLQKDQENTCMKGRVSAPRLQGEFEGRIDDNSHLSIDYSGQIQGAEPGQVAGHIRIASKEDISFTVELKHFPVALLDLEASKSNALRKMLGPHLDLSIKGAYTGNLARVSHQHSSQFGQIALSDAEENPEGRVNLTLPRDSLKADDETDGQSDRMVGEKPGLDAVFCLNTPALALEGQLTGVPSQFQFNVQGHQAFYGKKAEIMGSQMQMHFTGTGCLFQNSLTLPTLCGAIQNPDWNIQISGKLGNQNQVFSLEQVDLTALGTFAHLPIEDEIGEIDLKNGRFSLQFNGAHNDLAGKFQVAAHVEGNEINAIEGSLSAENVIQNGRLNRKQMKVSFHVDAPYFPVSALSILHKHSNQSTETYALPSLIGPIANVHASGVYSPSEPERALTVDLKAKGEGFHLQFGAVLDQDMTVKQEEPGYLRWEMTPARYQTLMHLIESKHAVDFQLVRPAILEVHFDRFILPNLPGNEIGQNLFRTGFMGNLKASPLIFMNQHTQETISFYNVCASIAGEDFSKSIAVRCEGLIAAENIPAQEKSAFLFDGQLLNFWTQKGHFNREGLAVQGELSLEYLPVRQITGIIPFHPETRKTIQAVLGELINTRIHGSISQMSGPLTIDVKASNFKATLPLQLENGWLTLRDYVEAEITFTEAVSETLLKGINPLLITGAYSESPIRVFIEPEGFMFPLRNFAFKNIHIPKAIIDIGKIRVRNGGHIQALMEFLKAKEITSDRVMEAWFTPIFMRLEDGVAHYKRFDALLANSVHIALWGKIDLIKDKVKMMLGIAPTTLQQRFGILGLTKKDLFQVKMRGSTTKLDLDWSSAYKRIGVVITRTAGGGIGYLVGGLVEQIMNVFGEETAPDPTTTPFPWEAHYPSEPGGIPQEAPPKKGKKKAIKKFLEFLIP